MNASFWYYTKPLQMIIARKLVAKSEYETLLMNFTNSVLLNLLVYFYVLFLIFIRVDLQYYIDFRYTT